MKKILLLFLVLTIYCSALAQDIKWINLQEIYNANDSFRMQKLSQLGFHFEDSSIVAGMKQPCLVYKAKKIGKGGMWFEKIVICLGRKQFLFMTENTTLYENLRQDLIGQLQFKENVDQEGGTYSDGVLYTKDNYKIKLYSTPGDDGQTNHFINVVTFGNPQTASISCELNLAKYHALIIAVSNYSDSTYNLKWPVITAIKFKNVLLQKYGFEEKHVYELVGSPTRLEILNTLEDLRKLGVNDNLIIYFSGHGAVDHQAKEGYWLPSDGDEQSRSNAISNYDLISRIRGLLSCHVLVIADACYSGVLFKFKPLEVIPDKSISSQYKFVSRQAITSAGLQKSPDETPFMKRLIEVLERNSLDFLSASELFRNIVPVINEQSKFDKRIPIPEFGNLRSTEDQGGEFIFQLKH